MNPIRVLTRLNPKTSNWMSSGIGQADFDIFDCAALCKGANDRYFIAAKVKFANDLSDIYQLEKLLWIWVCGLARRENWSIPKDKDGRRRKEFLRKLADLAICEMANEKKFKPDIIKAGYLGIAQSNYSRRWKKRYEEGFIEVNDWANTMYNQINKAQNID